MEYRFGVRAFGAAGLLLAAGPTRVSPACYRTFGPEAKAKSV